MNLLQMISYEAYETKEHQAAVKESAKNLVPRLTQLAECQLDWIEGAEEVEPAPSQPSTSGIPLMNTPASAAATITAACSYFATLVVVDREVSSVMDLGALSVAQLRLLAVFVRLYNAVMRRAAGVGVSGAKEREEWCSIAMRYHLPGHFAVVSLHLSHFLCICSGLQ